MIRRINDYLKIYKASSWFIRTLLLISFLSTSASGQKLSIQSDQFFWNGRNLPMWGIRVASASQSDENTQKLLEALPEYKKYGVNSISVYLQGSSGGYSDPFLKNGKEIDADHLNRLIRIIEACRKREMVVIVGIFYQRTMATDSICNLQNEKGVYRAVKTITKNLRPFENVIINIANEQNSSYYRRYDPFDFNDAQNIINLCRHVTKFDRDRIVGGGGYNDSLNIIIGRSEDVDVLLFDTFSGDIENNQHSGWHYDYFKKMGVPDKPFINVEIFGGWTRQFVPPGVYTEEGRELHLQEIDEAMKRPGLHVHLHSNVWMQGPSDGYPIRYHLGGMGTEHDPGIRWWFEHLQQLGNESTPRK